jgi:hypothetical protein
MPLGQDIKDLMITSKKMGKNFLCFCSIVCMKILIKIHKSISKETRLQIVEYLMILVMHSSTITTKEINLK